MTCHTGHRLAEAFDAYAPESAVFEEVAEEAAGDVGDDHRVRLGMRLKPRRKIVRRLPRPGAPIRLPTTTVPVACQRGHEGRYRFRSERRPRPRPAPVSRASPATHEGSRNRRATPSHLVDCNSTVGTRAVIDYDGLVCGPRYAIEHHARNVSGLKPEPKLKVCTARCAR